MGKYVLGHLPLCSCLRVFMIISFASSKGGVGKSTICAAIGAYLARSGEEVLMLDLDQNRTVERWGRKAKIGGLTVKARSHPD
jgi:chromosome partitioning protein